MNYATFDDGSESLYS